MTRAFTLTEVLIVIIILGIVAGLAAPRAAKWRDRMAVNRAADEMALFYQRVRFGAVLKSATVRIEFGSDRLTAESENPSVDLTLSVPGPARRRVDLEVSRPIIRLHPNGLGLGPANTKLVLRRGEAAESLTVSRLGRLKRWK